MHRYLAELIGSFILVFSLGLPGDPLSTGLLLIGLIYMGGPFSGAHYNPAVTLAFWSTGSIGGGELVRYLASQFAGAFGGCLLIAFLAGIPFHNSPDLTASPFQYVTVELIFSFLLCMVYLVLFLSRQLKNNQVYGIVIGLVYAGVLFTGEPISGGVINPAVAAATYLADLLSSSSPNSLQYLAIYLLAPLSGGLIAGNLFVSLMKPESLRQEGD